MVYYIRYWFQICHWIIGWRTLRFRDCHVLGIRRLFAFSVKREIKAARIHEADVTLRKRYYEQNKIIETPKFCTQGDENLAKTARALDKEMQVDEVTVWCEIHENFLEELNWWEEHRSCPREIEISTWPETNASITTSSWNIKRNLKCSYFCRMRKNSPKSRKWVAKIFVVVLNPWRVSEDTCRRFAAGLMILGEGGLWEIHTSFLKVPQLFKVPLLIAGC